MHCRNCGKSINDKAVICVHCASYPLVESKHCQECGEKTTENQSVCVKCGVPLINKGGPRIINKAVAVILSLLLGIFGVHKFYYGSWGWGIVYLFLTYFNLFTAFFLASTVVNFNYDLLIIFFNPGLLILFDFLFLLSKNKYNFNERYNQTPQHAFKW